MRPSWFKLLVHNQDSRRRFGLTLVFLLGALRSPPGRVIEAEDANFAEFIALLTSMRDETPESHYIHVGECDRLHQPVANPTSSYSKPSAIDCPLPSPASNRTAVVFQPKYLPDPARGIESVSETLWPLLAKPVMAGKFSFHEGTFHRFGKDDRAFIAQALSLPDDDET